MNDDWWYRAQAMRPEDITGHIEKAISSHPTHVSHDHRPVVGDYHEQRRINQQHARMVKKRAKHLKQGVSLPF